MEKREKLAKKVRWIGNSILVADTGLIIMTMISGSTLIAAFSSGVAIHLGITLTGASLLLSIATPVTWKRFSAIQCEAKKKTRRFNY